MSSIKALGEAVDLKKLVNEIDTYTFEPVDNISEVPEKYIRYIINDVLIALRSFRKFRELIFSINPDVDIVDHITLGSLTRKLMKSDSNEHYFKISPKDYELATKLYRGGFTQFNPKYQKIYTKVKNLRVIDVNSAYPYFLSLPLPYGTIEVDKNTEVGDYGVYVLSKVKGKIKKEYKNILIFPNHHNVDLFDDNRYVPEFDLEELTVFSKELRMFEKFYNMTYEVKKVYSLMTTPFLKDYIYLLFNHKRQFKKNSSSFLKCIKILLNSVYGSMCLSAKYDNYFYFTEENFTPIVMKKSAFYNNRYEISTYSIKGQSFTYNVGRYHCFRYDDLSCENKCHNKLAAAWVTSMQRCKLFETILALSNPAKQ